MGGLARRSIRLMLLGSGLLGAALVAPVQAQMVLSPHIGRAGLNASRMHANQNHARYNPAMMGMGMGMGVGVGMHYPNHARRMGSMNGANNHGQGRIVAELRATKLLLERADADYKGHRVRAIQDITLAIHSLSQGGNMGMNSGMGMGGGTGMGMGGGMGMGMNVGMNGNRGRGGNRAMGASSTGRANREPQAVSDGQLRQALQRLSMIQNQMKQLGGGQNGQARVAIQRAMTELHTALTIR